MPRLSLWRENHSNDYHFHDNMIRELFTVSGAGIWIHKLLGSSSNNVISGDATQPVYLNQSEKNIQDLLFMENRNRKYDPDIYKLRGHYTISDSQFNLSQFGLFLNNDTMYITFHINDMIDRMGRKLIPGDVLEMPNMKDLWPLDETIPTSLKKFYVVDEVLRAAEGYAATWWPHLYRVKVSPMINGQEFNDILNKEQKDSDGKKTGRSLNDLLSTYNQNMAINNAIIDQAENDVTKSGYDTGEFFILPVWPNGTSRQDSFTANNLDYNNDFSVVTPRRGLPGYLTGDVFAPNGFTVQSMTYFPESPKEGQYVLRVDYLPNTLYRWDGRRWQSVHNVERVALTGNANQTQMGTFVNNTQTTTASDGRQLSQRQSLNHILSPKSDF